MLVGMNSVFRGWALTEQGRGEEGVKQIGQGVATYTDSSGGECLKPHYYSAAERRMNVAWPFKAGEGEPSHPSRRAATR